MNPTVLQSSKPETTPRSLRGDDVLVQLENVSKAFPQSHARQHRLRSIIRQLRHGRAIHGHPVLTDISFRIKRGESLAIIGENGAGKSTLLKLICSVLNPTKGQIRVNARISALLELGAGFHPEFTGLDNLRLVAAISGLTQRQIRQREQAMIDFADIGDYINHPVKHYSSGMVVRLGFAIMTQTDPELLITDEALAVGDQMFQQKCQRWLDDYLVRGGSLILVSHGMDQVKRLCGQAIWLHEGRIRAMGNSHQIADEYLAFQDLKYEENNQIPPSYNGNQYRLTSLTVNEKDTVRIESGQAFRVRAEVYSPDDRAPVLALGIKTEDGRAVYGTTSEIARAKPAQLGPNQYHFAIEFDSTPLLAGHYRIFGHAMDPEGLRLFDTLSCSLIIQGESSAESDTSGFADFSFRK